MSSVSVVIPNYNGTFLLQRTLPPLLDALVCAEISWEVIVVDDASTDESVDFLSKMFPEVILLQNEHNSGFAATVNRGIHAARYDIVMTLNTDVTVERDIFSVLLPRFADPELFALSPSIIDPKDGRNQASYRLIPGTCWFIDRCVQEFSPEQMESGMPIFFASGGATLYSREKLLKLGGFPTIYHPFYIEDVDLAYQGWKAGWKCLVLPSVRVWHESSSTIKKFHKYRKIRFVTGRNKHIFLWLNITDFDLIIRYFVWLIPSLVWDVLSFRKYKLVGFFMALSKIDKVIKERNRRKGILNKSDRDIWDLVSYKF